MQNLQHELIELLKTQDNLLIDKQLNKNKIIELGLKVEPQLIGLLIKSPTFKKHFFTEVESVLVFDKIKFQRFVNNKSFLPDSYTAFKNKIGLTINDDSTDNFIKAKNDVVLAFPHKDCVLEGGQTKEDQKRNEIFWNETLAPDNVDRLLDAKAFTNFKKYDKDGEHKITEFTGNENLILKGNNLLTLSSLLKTHRGKIKLIYIDPPYNTGGDANIFSYNNTFNHSTWLTFMKNRLTVAKNMLTKDGFITIAIDHAELFYLGVLADEIFGRENRIGIVTVLHNPKGRNQAKFFSENSEYMLVYAKDINIANFNQVAIDEDVIKTFTEEDDNGKYRYENYIRARTVWSRKNRPNNWYPIYVSPDLKIITTDKTDGYHELFSRTDNGDFSWKNIKSSFKKLNNNNYFKAKKVDKKVVLYHKYYEQQVFKNVWVDKKYQSEFNGTNLLKKLIGKNDFSYPKSLYAVIDIIKITTKPGDLVLDFFGGSGTTAHAVLEVNAKTKGVNRNFILIEQLDEHINIIKKRLNNLFSIQSNSFIYAELLEYNQKYINQIQKTKTKEDVLKVWQEMEGKVFLSFQFDKDIFNERLDTFNTATLETMQQYLIEILDKNQLYVNFSEIEDENFAVSEEDKALNYSFYKKNN
ncbi:site-specific DNA-methyltransferase [Tenacibaculum maritimum]|nr:site-specific DNA-methyltransferase [Tenacibaculum maritimum]MDB0602684.1 site-specific DNA-methyltransferase [Tenacibaculum maritimum]MDB0611204.1 site-specific DNA-methyltransferase [Tenacibaculum maritimum]